MVLLWFLDFVSILVGVLISVAFFTLLERKLLGYAHYRKGPTKIVYWGLLQPISDAIKLFFKEFLKGFKVSYYFFVGGPVLGLFFMFVLWGSYMGFFGCFGSMFLIIYVFVFMGLGVYFLLFCGWGSGSKYALLGAYRSVSQTVSYEMPLIFLCLVVVFTFHFYDFSVLIFYESGYWLGFVGMFLVVTWLFMCLAEGNRTPFDFSEGESELVSGFNVEFSGGLFSLIFISEYGMLIFLSYLSVLVFLGGGSFAVKILGMCFFFVWVRGCFPRFRYDLLMGVAWEKLLPLTLFILLLGAVWY